MKQKLEYAEKRIQELLQKEILHKIDEKGRKIIFSFYESKSLNRLESAKIIFRASSDRTDFTDYSEVVAAAYYSMYYIVHSYLAKIYGLKIRENTMGAHSITEQAVLYYLVKTNKLAKHLYEQYVQALETAAETHKLSTEHFQGKAYEYASKYDKCRDARERFTYNTVRSAEAYHAETAISFAEEFIGIVRQLMLPKK